MKHLIYILIFLVLSEYLISQQLPSNQGRQFREGQSLEKIIAIVGDEIILQSELDGQLIYMSQIDKSLNPNDPTLREKILNGLIDQLLMVSKAIKDSVIIRDDEINQRLEIHIQSEIRRFGSEARLEQAYGMSIPRIKNEIREKIKQNLLVQTLISQKFMDVKITQKEVLSFYDNHKDSIPKLPPSIQLYHLVKKVSASDETKESIYNLAQSVRDSILKGGSFSDFASRYSADEATAKDGGELGWFERGKLFPEFEQAALKLTIGELSQPVESPYGYHLIQTLEKKANELKTRHILFKFAESNTENEKTIAFLQDIRQKIAAGQSFDSLAKMYSDDKDSRSFGGFLGNVSVNDIPANIKGILDTLRDGGTSEPMIYKNEPGNRSYNIIYKKKSLPERSATIPEDIKEVEAIALDFKKKEMYENWLKELRNELYWEIIK